jgi:hypothetical protein
MATSTTPIPTPPPGRQTPTSTLDRVLAPFVSLAPLPVAVAARLAMRDTGDPAPRPVQAARLGPAIEQIP